MTEKTKDFAFDLSEVKPLRAKGPDGVVWTFPEPEDRDYVQTALYQRHAEANMHAMKATSEGRDDLDEFLLFASDSGIRLLMHFLKKESTGLGPTEEEAADLVLAGFARRLITSRRIAGGAEAEKAPKKGKKGSKKTDDGARQDGEAMFDEMNLDEFKKDMSRPIPEEPGADTPNGSSESSVSTEPAT